MALAYRRGMPPPDFFLYDGEGRLVYRGAVRRKAGRGNDVPVTGLDLRRAVDAPGGGKGAPRPTGAQSGLQHQVEAGE